MKFDYLSKEYKRGDPTKLFTLNFRIVRIEISEGSYEMMVTNLPKEDSQKEELKELLNKAASGEIKITLWLQIIADLFSFNGGIS